MSCCHALPPVRPSPSGEPPRLMPDRKGNRILYIPDGSPKDAAMQFMSGWNEASALRLLPPDGPDRMLSSLEACLSRHADLLGIRLPQIRLITGRRCWGTCCPGRGVIGLHESLQRMPPEIPEEVMLHELCHFVYFDHDREFWKLLTELMPDWPRREGMLRCFGKTLRADGKPFRREAMSSKSCPGPNRNGSRSGLI